MRNVGHSTTNCKNVRDMWKHNCKRLKYVQYINYCKALIFNEVKYRYACFRLSLSRELGSSILTKRNRPEPGKRLFEIVQLVFLSGCYIQNFVFSSSSTICLLQMSQMLSKGLLPAILFPLRLKCLAFSLIPGRSFSFLFF